jgi:Zn-dependent metalloprotease
MLQFIKKFSIATQFDCTVAAHELAHNMTEQQSFLRFK